MTDEKNVNPLVSMQQELCDMWGINNQTSLIQNAKDLQLFMDTYGITETIPKEY